MPSNGVVGPRSVQLDLGDSDQEQRAREVIPAPQLLGREKEFTPKEAVNAEANAKAEAEAAEAEAKGVKAARLISFASFAASMLAAVLGLGLGLKDESLSLIGFGLEALLDAVSDIFVLWRFKTPKHREHADAEAAARWKAERDFKRERNSGTGIGVTFIASAAFLFVSGVFKLITWDGTDPKHAEESDQGAHVAVLLSIPSAVLFGFIAWVKFRLAHQLNSSVLRKDALCSVLGAILALIVAVAGLAGEAMGDPEGMAQVDAVASMVIACILFFEGSRTIYHHVIVEWNFSQGSVADQK